MKKVNRLAFSIMLLACCMHAAERPFQSLTPEERRAKIRNAKINVQRQGVSVRDQGGIVIKPVSGKRFCVAVSSKSVPRETVDETVQLMRQMVSIPIEVVESDQSTPATYLKKDTGAVVILFDGGDSPTLLVAPEDGWAMVNVSNLSKDKPYAKAFRSRLSKELWRASAFVLGAANSSFKPCLMCPVKSVQDLDAMTAQTPCPEPFNKMIDGATSFGIEPIKMATYQKACEEGWAPAPTNDVQKAIWDKVHAMPKNPMKIEFDPKKGK